MLPQDKAFLHDFELYANSLDSIGNHTNITSWAWWVLRYNLRVSPSGKKMWALQPGHVRAMYDVQSLSSFKMAFQQVIDRL